MILAPMGGELLTKKYGETSRWIMPIGLTTTILLYSLNGTTGAPPVSISIHNYCWFPASGYRAKANGNIGAPTNGYLYPFNVNTAAFLLYRHKQLL